MKTTIIIFGLALTFLLSGLVGQTPTPAPLPNIPDAVTAHDSHGLTFVWFNNEEKRQSVVFDGKLHNAWLWVTRHNSGHDFDPCFTDITSDFRPVVQKDGAKWRIIFESQDLTTEFVP